MQGPLVSVIVPCYNGEQFLAAALESIRVQAYHSLEVIVVDDGSLDRSFEVARSWSGVRCLQQHNQGPAAARNTGAAASRGEILTFLDADDQWGEDKLVVQISHLMSHPEVDLSFGFLQNFLEPGTVRPAWLPEKLLTQLDDALVASTVAVRRPVWDWIGPFDTTLRLGEDTDWHNRAQELGAVLVQLPSIVLRRRIHTTNISHEHDQAGRGYWQLRVAHRWAQRRRQADRNPGPPSSPAVDEEGRSRYPGRSSASSRANADGHP